MRFVSRFADREPFSTLSARNIYVPAKSALERANENLKKRLVGIDRLMYNIETGGIFDAATGKLFSGKFLIPADKFERIVKVSNGMEVSNLVRIKDGKNYYLDIIGHEPKRFKIDMTEAQLQAETQKMIDADQAAYDRMVDTFVKKTEINYEN